MVVLRCHIDTNTVWYALSLPNFHLNVDLKSDGNKLSSVSVDYKRRFLRLHRHLQVFLQTTASFFWIFSHFIFQPPPTFTVSQLLLIPVGKQHNASVSPVGVKMLWIIRNTLNRFWPDYHRERFILNNREHYDSITVLVQVMIFKSSDSRSLIFTDQSFIV